MFQPATYVSIWDYDTIIRTNCEVNVNEEIPIVKNIESVDVDNLNCLEEEYVELNGKQILTFQDLDNDRLIEDGQNVFIEDIDSDSKLYRIITDKQD